MKYCAIRYATNDSLCHHGIKGQKWGVRRFQNSDGTLTAAGKKRYYSSTTTDTHDQGDDRFGMYAMLGLGFAGGLALNAATIMSGYIYPMAAAYTFLAGAGLLTMAVKDITSAAKNLKIELETKNNKVDEKTGLKLKNKEFTEKQDLKRTNPEYGNTASNTKSNCMLCTTAYDMRRRGYEVRANKASWGYDEEDVNRWYPKAKIEHVKGATNKESQENLFNELSNQKNARGNLIVSWDYDKTGSFGGHSMVYEVKDGKVSILDAQSGKTYVKNAADSKSIIQSYNNPLDNATNEYTYIRYDNVDFDPQKIKEAVR